MSNGRGGYDENNPDGDDDTYEALARSDDNSDGDDDTYESPRALRAPGLAALLGRSLRSLPAVLASSGSR